MLSIILRITLSRDCLIASFFSIQFTICLLQNWKSWKRMLTSIWKKNSSSSSCRLRMLSYSSSRSLMTVLFVRKLSWVERDNHQESIFIVFDKWEFEQIVRNKNLFKIERSKCLSSYSHKKWRRVKNDVQMSIRSLSISSDVFRINKFVDNFSNLYQSSHAFLFKRFRIDLYKRYIDFFAIDEKARWTCQANSETTEKIQSFCQVQQMQLSCLSREFFWFQNESRRYLDAEKQNCRRQKMIAIEIAQKCSNFYRICKFLSTFCVRFLSSIIWADVAS